MACSGFSLQASCPLLLPVKSQGEQTLLSILPGFYRSNKPGLLNLLSPTEANLIFGENNSQGYPWMVVIYKIIKKTDSAPVVTKLCSAKVARGTEIFVC